MPKWRTEEYAIWRSCERFQMLPPGVYKEWDSNTPWIQAMLISYSQIRQIEEIEDAAIKQY